MIYLILGLFLWTAAHFFKRIAPAARARLGPAGQGLVALAIGAGLVLMVLGYRWADFIPLWYPPAFLTHVNNAAMLLAFWIYGSSADKGAKAWTAYTTRHPKHLAVKIRALAH